MSFDRISPDLLDVPGKMDVDEMAYLAALAAMVPKGGRIVEVGPFYGRSTNAMARANPSAQITSIDTFEDVEWTSRYADRFSEIPAFGRAAFEHYTQDLDNVTAIEGFSPDVVADWNAPVDMYFEDAIHGNPGLKRNLDFWISHLKPGGIACGHDYTRRFPDIKREVDAWAARWGTKVEIVGSLWALRKPIPGEDLDVTQRGLTPRLGTLPRLLVKGANMQGGPKRTREGYWCGAHLEMNRLKWIAINDIEPETGLRVEYRLGNPQFGTTDWIAAGEKARLDIDDFPSPFTRLAVRVMATNGKRAPHVLYRVSARQIGNGGARLSGTSDWAANGDWAHYRNEGAAVSAIAVALSDTLPAKAQSAFTEVRKTGLLQDVKRKIVRTLGLR